MFIQWLFIGLLLAPTVNALECYVCDSTENTECATRPGQQIEVEECANVDDQCVTVIVAGHTRRGCLSRLFPNKYCPEPCQRCDTNLCNRNIFPTDRLRCYQCLGSDCVKVENKTSLILPCPIYNDKDRCYTNIIRDSNVQRGCEYTNLPTTCPNICLKCNYDGCNNEPGAHEDSCLECTHTSMSPNPDCLRDITPVLPGKRCAIAASTGSQLKVKTCFNKLMYGHKAKCFTYYNPQTNFVQRGCSTTKPLFPTGNLTECYGKNCNNGCLPIACSACNASTITENMQCRSGINLRSELCDTNTFACYACEAPNTLRRGCSNSSFVPSENEACYHCSDADGCNSKKPLRTCYHCSSRDDASCATTIWDNNRIAKKICSSQSELCVSTVVNKLNMAYVVRGCMSTVPDCSEFDPYCVRCNGSLCNNVPIEWKPFSRISSFTQADLNGKNGVGGQKITLLNMRILEFLLCLYGLYYLFYVSVKSN